MAFQNIVAECRGCGASISMDPTLRFGTCPYCGNRNSLVPAGEDTVPPVVESVYPAHFSEQAFRGAVRAFLCTHPDVPDALYESLTERELTLNFWPFYRHEIAWTANWTANIGYADDHAKNGIAWQGASGQAFGTGVIYAPAASVIDRRGFGEDACRLAADCGNEPLRFHPELLTGTSCLKCDVEADKMENRYVAPVLDRLVAAECARQIPGDYDRDLRKTVRINERCTSLQMIPFWLFVYEWSGETYFVLQNAATGEVSGSLPATSRRKWIARGLTAAGALLAGGISFLVWAGMGNYDGVLILALTAPLAMAGGIYRNIITARKSRIKLAPVSEIAGLLNSIRRFEKRFLSLTGLVMIAWTLTALGVIAVLPVILPFWRDPIWIHKPVPPEKPVSPSEKRKREKKVIPLKRRNVEVMTEEVRDDSGNTFVIEK